MCQVSSVTCHQSSLACHLSLVTCHVSLRQQPQPQNLPLITPPQYAVGWFAKPHKPKNKSIHIKTTYVAKRQSSRGMPILALHSLNRSLQSSWQNRRLHAMGHADITTTSLNRPPGRCSENPDTTQPLKVCES